MGNEQWNQTYGGSEGDSGNQVQRTIDGGYIIIGTTLSYGAGEVDGWLIKTDDNGNKEWDVTFGYDSYDYGVSVQQTLDGGYVIAGFKYVIVPGKPDAWLIKTDYIGNKEWEKTFGGSDDDLALHILQTDDGYVIVGRTSSYGAGSTDAWLVKLIPEGGTPEIVVNNINGGFRVSAEIKNIGTETANNVSWSIDMDNAWIILRGELTEDVISELAAGESETIRQHSLFAIGRNVLITVSAATDVKQANASWVLGPLVLGVT
jgi:hypothetical protein